MSRKKLFLGRNTKTYLYVKQLMSLCFYVFGNAPIIELGCDFFERVRIKRVDIKFSRNTEDVPVFSFFLCFMSGLVEILLDRRCASTHVDIKVRRRRATPKHKSQATASDAQT